MTEPVGGSEADALGVAVSYTGGLSEAFQADVEGMRPVVGSLVEDLTRLRAASSGIEIDPLAGSIRGFESDVARILAGFAEIRRAQEQAVTSGVGPLGGRPLDVQLQSFAREQLGAASTRFETSSAGIPGASEIASVLRSAATELASAAGKEQLSLARQNLREQATPQVVREAVGANSNRLNVNRLDAGGVPAVDFTPVEGQADRLRAALTSLTETVRQAEEQARQAQDARSAQPAANEVARRDQAAPPAPRPSGPSAGSADGDEDDFASRVIPPTPSPEDVVRQREQKLKDLQQQWAKDLEAAFQLPPSERPQPFGSIGYDPLRDVGERAFHVNTLNEAGDDFKTANPYNQAIYEQKSALRLLQDLVKGGDPHVVDAKDYYVDYSRNVQQPDVYTKQAGSRITPASQDEYAKALSQAQTAARTQPGKYGDLLAITGGIDGAAEAEAQRIAELNARYEELYAQNLAKRLTSKIGYDPTLPAGQRAFNTDTFMPLEGTEQEYYSRRGLNWQLQQRLDAADPSLTPVGRNVLRDTSGGDGADTAFYFRQSGEALVASTEQVRAALTANKAAIERATAATDRESLLRYQAAAAEEEAARAGLITGPSAQKSLIDYFKGGFLGTYGHGGGHGGGSGGSGGSGGDEGDGRSGAFSALAELTQQGGMAAKYSLLYGGAYRLMQLLPDMARDVVNTNTAVTDLNIAFDGTTQVTQGLTDGLENVASVTGANVSEAMQVAAQGVRAFRDEVGNTGPALNQLAIDFADQANQISVITGATLADAGKFQTAIAGGFNLPKNQVGFSQITDAVAGARNITGGDSNEILSGLGAGAVDFHQLGFSLDQAAILLGKINAMTGDSGDTAVQRLSRIGEILGSQTGRNYITTTLNPALAPDQRVNASGTPAEQLAQLAKVFPTLNTGQQSAFAASLGGPQGQKEFLATLQAARDLGQQILPGTGADEFEQKVNSIAGSLKDILGNFRAFLQNLATSGLADPIVALLDFGLKPLSAALKYVTQAFDTLTNVIPGLFPALAGIGELLLTLKAIQAVRGNGGVGGTLRGIERVARPQSAEARARLEGAAASGVAANPLARVPVALTGTETSATRALAAAAATVEADTVELVRIQRALDAQEIRHSRTRTDFVDANPGDGAGLAALRAQQAEERAALQARLNDQRAQVVTSTVEQNRAASVVATEQGRYSGAAASKASAVDAAQQRFAEQVDGIRAQAAGLAAGTEELKALENQEIEARAQFLAELRALDAEELAAREAAVIEQAAGSAGGGLVQGLKGFAGGLVGGLGGLGVGLVATAAVTALVDGIGTLKDTSDKLTTAVQEGRANQRTAVGTQGSQYAATADGFRQLSQNDAAAAEAIRRNRSGFFGALAATMNPDAERVQGTNEALSKYDSGAAERLQGLQNAQARSLGSGVPGAIDLSGTDDVATSLKNLSAQGYSASHIVDAITASLKQLSFVGDPLSNKLSQVQIGGVAAGVGRGAVTGLQATQGDLKGLQDVVSQYSKENGGQAPTQAQLRAFLSGRGGYAAPYVQAFQKDNPGLDVLGAVNQGGAIQGLDAKSVGDLVNNTTASFLNDPKFSGKDLTAQSTLDAYKQVLEANLTQAQIPPDVAATIARTSVTQFSAQVANLKSFFSDPKKVQDLLTNGPTYLQQQQQDVTNLTKVANAAKGGVAVDTSGTAGLQSVQASLAQWRASVEAGKKSGAIKAEDYPQLINMITELQTKNQVDQINQAKQEAQQQIAFNDKVRQQRQRAATSAKEVLAIGAKAFTNAKTPGNPTTGTGDADIAIKSGDVDLITQVFDGATKAQVKALQDTYDNAVKIAKAKAAADKVVARQAHEMLSVLKLIGLTGPELDAAIAAATAADAAAALSAGALGKVQTDANNVNSAAGAANPTGTATQGVDANGGTQAQIAAQNEAATAERNRNSLASLKAAVDKAKADANAPGLNASARAQAAQALAQAQNAYDDGVRAQGAALAKAGLFPTDKVGAAKADLDAARANLNVYSYKSKEWADAQAAFAKAQYDYNQAVTEAYFNKVKVNSDLTDPVKQASIALRQARAQLANDKRNGADPNTLVSDRLAVEDKQNSQEATVHSRTVSHLQDLESAQKISHAQYLQGLQAEQARILERLKSVKKGSNMYTQLNDELLSVQKDIIAANTQLQGQFNLGDIKIPTVYEVRRAIASQTSAVAAVANTVTNNNQQITINGVDIDKALDAVERRLQAKLNAGRHANSARKV